jgi:malate dehydrogenase
MQKIKVAITGATGQVGYAFLFLLLASPVFRNNTLELCIYDLPASENKLEGIKMELEDSGFENLAKISATTNLEVAFLDADWIILIGSQPRTSKDMERKELLRLNGEIFCEQGKIINEKASRDVKVLVVGNPCNTNCLIAMHHAPKIPRENFFAMTMLDEMRARFQLAKKIGVFPGEISKLAVWGNHSATMFPDFYQAEINQRPISEIFTDQGWLQKDFLKSVRSRGAKIIEQRKVSSGASAAWAVVESLRNLLNDTEGENFYSMGLVANGAYGINEDLIFSFPCRTENGRVSIVRGIDHGQFAQSEIDKSLRELEQEREIVTKLGCTRSP